MDTWYSIEIADGNTAQATMKRVMDAFMPKYIGSGRPLDMAIFSSHDADSGLWTLYFSPKAMSLAMRFGASPFSGEFVDLDLALLVGDERSMAILFPDTDSH